MHSWELLPNALAGGSGLHQVRRLSVQRACAQDTTLMRLLARDELMTLGADERDIDWRSAWLAELAKDDKPTDRQKGARAPPLWCNMQQRACLAPCDAAFSPGGGLDSKGLAASHWLLPCAL